MKRPHPIYLATLMLASAGPADAVTRETRSPVSEYVRARAADAAGMPELAAAQYAQVLTVSPDDEILAVRAYRQAMIAGDRALAVRAGQKLADRGSPPPDVRLLLLGEAVSARDWAGAKRIVDKIEEEDVLAFLVSSLRAWIALGSKSGDPIALLDATRAGSLGAAYAGEQRALMLFALGRQDEGIASLRTLGLQGDGRAARLRIAAAASLAASKAKDGRENALALLTGDNPAIVAARRRLEADKPLRGAIESAPQGIAELLTRIAIDINRERVTPLALGLARTSTFLAPDNAESWLVTSELLSAAEQYEAASAALAEVKADDPFAAAAREARLQLLIRKGEKEEALAAALAASTAPDAGIADMTRVGDIYTEMDRHAEAAAAYGRALDLAQKQKGGDQLWTLWLLRGGALEQAGDWHAAKPALQKALALAPDQAVVLNYLGYAQLERRENLDQAEQLIERASRLKPDDASITDSLGWVYYQRGNLPKAIATLERAVASEPAEPTINEHLGDAYWTAGRRYEARYAWAAALVYADEKLAARINAKLSSGLAASGAKP
jgi:tetratricopeptide (TPR) repeat protein